MTDWRDEIKDEGLKELLKLKDKLVEACSEET